MRRDSKFCMAQSIGTSIYIMRIPTRILQPPQEHGNYLGDLVTTLPQKQCLTL